MNAQWHIDYKVIKKTDNNIIYRFLYQNGIEKKSFMVSYDKKEMKYYCVVLSRIPKTGIQDAVIVLGDLTLTELLNELCFK